MLRKTFLKSLKKLNLRMGQQALVQETRSVNSLIKTGKNKSLSFIHDTILDNYRQMMRSLRGGISLMLRTSNKNV
jgi:hypothetical protein